MAAWPRRLLVLWPVCAQAPRRRHRTRPPTAHLRPPLAAARRLTRRAPPSAPRRVPAMYTGHRTALPLPCPFGLAAGAPPPPPCRPHQAATQRKEEARQPRVACTHVPNVHAQAPDQPRRQHRAARRCRCRPRAPRHALPHGPGGAAHVPRRRRRPGRGGRLAAGARRLAAGERLCREPAAGRASAGRVRSAEAALPGALHAGACCLAGRCWGRQGALRAVRAWWGCSEAALPGAAGRERKTRPLAAAHAVLQSRRSTVGEGLSSRLRRLRGSGELLCPCARPELLCTCWCTMRPHLTRAPCAGGRVDGPAGEHGAPARAAAAAEDRAGAHGARVCAALPRAAAAGTPGAALREAKPLGALHMLKLWDCQVCVLAGAAPAHARARGRGGRARSGAQGARG